MGEKRDSGSKDADNFGAEFGTDQAAAQRQAATRRNQAVQRRRSSAGDDRASGKTPVPVVTTPVVTTPTGGQPSQATLTAVSNTQQAPRQLVPDPGMMATSLGQDLMRSTASVPELERLLLARQNANRSVNIAGPTPRPLTFEQEVQNLINSPGFDPNADLPPSPLDALAGDSVQIFDEDDPAGDRFLNPNLRNDEVMIFDEDDLRGDVFLNPSLPQDPKNFGDEFGGNIRPRLTSTNVAPRVADVRMLLNEFNQNQGSGIASLPGVSPTSRPTGGDDTNQGRSFPNIVTGGDDTNQNRAFPSVSVPEPDLGFEDVDDDDSFFPVTNEPQDITALNPNFLSRLPLVGDALYQGQINQLQQFASIPGSQYDYSTGSGTAQAGQGTLNLSPSGIVTYSGPRDGSYTGPFANLVNPPERPDKDVSDPCPPGFQLIGGVCRPTYDVTAPAAPAAPTPGSNFQMTPTAGFPTSFAPSTQATPVPLPDPFVLSPTGAAIGRRV